MTSTKKDTFQLSQFLIFSCFILFPLASYSGDYFWAELSEGIYDSALEDYTLNTWFNANNNGSGTTNNSQPSDNEINSDQEKKLTYKSNSDTHNQVRQSFIDYYNKFSPELAEQLKKTDLVVAYQNQAHNLGFDKNNMADAVALLWLQAWQVVHYTDTTTASSEKVIKAVKDQFRAASINAGLHNREDNFKQIYAELHITQAMLMGSGYNHAIKNNDQTALANMMQAARRSVEGIDSYNLTNKGFEVKKETLTPEGAELSDIYVNQLSFVTISKTVEKKRSVATTVVVVKTANDNWFQRHSDGNFSVWDLQISSLKNNSYSGNSGDTVFFDITESLDLSTATTIFPLTVYIGNIYNDGQLHWGYFNVKPL